MNIKICPENKVLNPKTNRCIKKPNIKICPENKVLNPKTNRCIKICPENKVLNPKKPNIKICPENKVINPKNINLFKKLFYPFINRINTNINDRIKYNNLLNKILNIDETNENYCMRLYKKNANGTSIYIIGNKIILKKQIGIESDNGAIFLSSFKDKYNKIYKYAIKCVVDNNANKKEIKLLKIVSNAVLNKKCPHFPILYSYIKCNNFLNFNIKSVSSEISKEEIEDIKNYPKIIQNNKKKSFYFLLNELANGDLKTFLELFHNDYYLLLNAFGQIYLSLMFYYQETKHFHYDAHWGNFLYHKVKAGGYFHYNIFGNDYYIENYGFLWVIWDYGSSIEFKQSKKEFIYVDYDFKNIIKAFFNDNDNGWLSTNFLLNSNFKNIIMKINKELFIDTSKELLFEKQNKYHTNVILKYKRTFNFYSKLPINNYTTPDEYEKFILYSPENINNIISFILNIFINNNVIKNKTNYNSKIINEKPYNIVFFK